MTAFRDPQFGIMVSSGIGGAMAEIIVDVVFARANRRRRRMRYAWRLRTVGRLPTLLPDTDRESAADFLAPFSAIVATGDRFTFEINPLKLATDEMAAVDGLLVIK